jgi:hypothetical protein
VNGHGVFIWQKIDPEKVVKALKLDCLAGQKPRAPRFAPLLDRKKSQMKTPWGEFDVAANSIDYLRFMSEYTSRVFRKNGHLRRRFDFLFFRRLGRRIQHQLQVGHPAPPTGPNKEGRGLTGC